MALSDEIRRLTRHFVEAYDDRSVAVADIHTSTAQQVAESHTAHQAMGAELRAHLDEQDSERRAQAAEDAQGRAEYVDGLHRDTAVFFKDLDSAHQAMAAELRAHLDEQESEWRAQAAEDAQGRAEYVDRLESDVTAMRGTLQVDLSEARQAWSSFAGQMQERRAGTPVAAPSPPSPREEVASDDLTAIRGIGSGTQRHLNEAGIFTYAQLTESTPEELRQVLGEGPQATKAGEWIEQAQGLVE